MKDLEHQQQHFDSIATQYTSSRQDPKHVLLKAAIWKFLFDHIQCKKDYQYNVLEAMCGAADGYGILKEYAFADFQYSAFDYSPKMVKEAQKRLPHENIFVQDITTFSEEDKYDIILVIGGLHHVFKHANIAVRNISNALKTNGLFINFEPTHNATFLRIIREYIYKKNSLFDESTEHGFTTSELNDLMQGNGLTPCCQFYPGLLAYILWYNPDAFPLLNFGSIHFAKSLVTLESKIWFSSFARYFSFATGGFKS